MFISYRVISPEEYDWATEHKPHLCPLVFAGDRRTGLQLLRDAAAESAQSMESLACSPGGQAKLDTLAASVESWAEELEQRVVSALGKALGAGAR